MRLPGYLRAKDIDWGSIMEVVGTAKVRPQNAFTCSGAIRDPTQLEISQLLKSP